MRSLDDLEDLKHEIKNASPTTEIMIGCDSDRFKKRGKWYASYAMVVIVHIDGNRGCKVFGKKEVIPDYGNLKQRLLMEVHYATSLATELLDFIEDRPFSIHLDINCDPKHKSQIAMKEAIGWVRGMFGFDPILKPDALAASTCADHFCRK